MKKSVAIFIVSLMLLSTIAFVSAGLFGDLWAKISGKVITKSAEINATCADSDNADIFVKGTTTYRYKETTTLNEDKCSVNARDLIEYSCINNQLDSRQYTCENGCEEGACVNIAGVAETAEEAQTADTTAGSGAEVGIVTEEPIQEVKLSWWSRFVSFIKRF